MKTSFPQASIHALLATAGTIESLAAMKEEIRRALGAGEIQPSAHTVRRWEEAIWVRVVELMQRQPRRAAYIFNVTLTWPKPAGMEQLLAATLREVLAPLPSDAEALVAQGIALEGARAA